MPRRENAEARERIMHAAFASFREVGYAAASYSEIAKRSGMSRALVQYYFKKKEDLAFALFTLLLEQTVDLLGYTHPTGPEKNRFVELYRIGQVHFAFLCKQDGYALLLKDILGSRELTEAALVFNGKWTYRYLGHGDDPIDSKTLDNIIMGMGGFYELLYYCLRKGRPMDIPSGLRQVIKVFMGTLGYADESDAILEPGTMSPSECEKICAQLEQVMYF